MSSTSFQESAASASGSKEPGCEPSPSAKSTRSAGASSQSTGQASLFTTTCEPSPGRSRTCVDVICGGFPCQDISAAGSRVGIDGERSGLWSEYARLIGELRPRYVIVENVADLLIRGLAIVLGDLAAIGYDAEWHCIPAAAVGADHWRDRLWIIAYPNGAGRLPLHFGWREQRRKKWAKMLPTITAHDYRGGCKPERSERMREQSARGLDLPSVLRLLFPDSTGLVRPSWAEARMGYPIGWTECTPSATPSSRKSRKSSGEQSYVAAVTTSPYGDDHALHMAPDGWTKIEKALAA
jgi:site-specific DNA-cytosine methylase